MTTVHRFRWRHRARHRAGWFGQYLIETRTTGGWHVCRVLDVSLGGLGLELLGPTAQIGERLEVELQATRPHAVDIPIRADVRYVGPGYEGGLVVGVEFVELDEARRALLRFLIALQSA